MLQQPPYLFALYTCPHLELELSQMELSQMEGYLDHFRFRVNACRNVFTYKANDIGYTSNDGRMLGGK